MLEILGFETSRQSPPKSGRARRDLQCRSHEDSAYESLGVGQKQTCAERMGLEFGSPSSSPFLFSHHGEIHAWLARREILICRLCISILPIQDFCNARLAVDKRVCLSKLQSGHAQKVTACMDGSDSQRCWLVLYFHYSTPRSTFLRLDHNTWSQQNNADVAPCCSLLIIYKWQACLDWFMPFTIVTRQILQTRSTTLTAPTFQQIKRIHHSTIRFNMDSSLSPFKKHKVTIVGSGNW